MDEKPDQIIGHIEAQREELGRNLNELETRVRQTTDWRTYYDRNPMMMLGAALGGGVLLGSLVANKRNHGRVRSVGSASNRRGGITGASSFASVSGSSVTGAPSGSSASSPSFRGQRSRIHDTMDQVKTALVAFGISKAKEFLNQAIPGFGDHLNEAERTHAQQQSTSSSGYYAGSQSGSYPGSHTAGSQDFRTHTHDQPVGAGSVQNP